MPTVIDPILYNAMLQSRQGALLELYGGRRVFPVCNCCISGNTVGVYKDPVPILEVSDTEVCTYTPISVEIDQSFSATSTIQTYQVDWGDGNITNGVWPPAGPISHPAGGYSLWGVYTITLRVTDLLGAYGYYAVDVNVQDCVTPLGYVPGEPLPNLGASGVWVYCTLKTDRDDYYTADITANPPVWTNIAHAPSNALEKTCLCYRNGVNNELYGYGYNGIWEYQNLPLGGGAWTSIRSAATIAADCGHGADYTGIYVFRMQFDQKPNHERWGWCGVCVWWTDAGVDHFGVWALHTRDAWNSLQPGYTNQLFELEDGVDWDALSACEIDENGLAIDMHGDNIYIVCGKAPSQDGIGNPLYDGWWRLYMSQDFGYSWTQMQTQTYTWGTDGYEHCGINYGMCDVWVPWVSDTYAGGTVFWTACMLDTSNNALDVEPDTLVYRSQNFGLSYTRIGDDPGITNLEQCLTFLKGPWNSAERVWGGVSNFNGLDAEQTKLWTWRDGYGWALWRDTNTPTWRNCYNMLVMEQTGYQPNKILTYEDPYEVRPSSETSKTCTEEECSWFTVVVQ